MIINHNLAALNTIRQLGINSNNTQKALEKLSSGLRINSAADDAAGLAISEKMRGQISGLEMAQKNAQDGISLISTAEGALNETHSILQRMRELAVQSSNDTNTNDDRKQLQKEVDQLAQEIGRIGKDTEFNTQKLLDGSFKGTFQIGANENQNITLNITDMRSNALGVTGDTTAVEDPSTDIAGTSVGTTSDISSADDGVYTVSKSGSTYNLTDSNGTVVATSTDAKTFTGNGTDGGSALGNDKFTLTSAAADGGQITITGGKVDKWTADVVSSSTLQAGDYTVDSASKSIKDANGQVIATSSDNKTFTDSNGNTVLDLSAATTNNLSLSVGGIDITSQTSANSAITTIDDAINKVSTQRSALGAYQNRLEHTINNLGTSSQNLTAAESRIRDVDMAKEMAEFTKNNILNQAAQAMLAQANQLPQGVLQLLR